MCRIRLYFEYTTTSTPVQGLDFLNGSFFIKNGLGKNSRKKIDQCDQQCKQKWDINTVWFFSSN